jgi:G:T-mismatch repair DNA endonuclease (very short patch repair protein)
MSADERRQAVLPFIKAGLRSNRRSSGTWSERVLAASLEAFGMAVARNVMVAHLNVDLLVEGRVIVECFGDYWHCNPELYEPNYFNKSLRCTAEAKWRRDSARINHLIELGYTVFVAWERDLRMRPERTSSLIERVLHALHE